MYATPQDMDTTFGHDECVALCDPTQLGTVDMAVMNGALERASSEIDGYLVARYALPFADVSRVLTGRCCDIARYHLATSYRILSEDIRLRYEDAITYLVQVANGRIGLTATTGAAVQTTAQMRLYSGERQFGRDATGGGAF
jgi:phage gp36-like protein